MKWPAQQSGAAEALQNASFSGSVTTADYPQPTPLGNLLASPHCTAQHKGQDLLSHCQPLELMNHCQGQCLPLELVIIRTHSLRQQRLYQHEGIFMIQCNSNLDAPPWIPRCPQPAQLSQAQDQNTTSSARLRKAQQVHPPSLPSTADNVPVHDSGQGIPSHAS